MKGKADTNPWCIQRLLITLFYWPHFYRFPREPLKRIKRRARREAADGDRKRERTGTGIKMFGRSERSLSSRLG